MWPGLSFSARHSHGRPLVQALDPINALGGFLTSLLAGALIEVAEQRDAAAGLIKQEEREKLRRALDFRRNHAESFDAAVAQAFRTLAPVEASNRLSVLF